MNNAPKIGYITYLFDGYVYMEHPKNLFYAKDDVFGFDEYLITDIFFI